MASCDSNTGSSSSSSSACGVEHAMPGYKAVWSYYHCGPFDGMWVQQGTLDPSTGAPLGDRHVGKGMISFKYTGLHVRNFQAGKVTYGLYFSAEGFDKREATWNWQTQNKGGNFLQHNLQSNRTDVNCRQQQCIQNSYSDEPQFYDGAETYRWDCRWNSADFLIVCEVTRVANPNYKLTLTNDMLGPYHALRYIGVGTKSYDGGQPSYDVKVTDFKVTIFE